MSGLSAVLIPYSAPGEPGLEIKAAAPKTGEWRCSTGLGRGLCPPGLNFRQGGGKSARPELPRALSFPDWQIPHQTHTLRG